MAAAAKSTWLALLLLVAAVAATRPPGSFGAFRRLTAASPVRLTHEQLRVRGGAIGLGEDADSEYEDEDDEYESEYDDDVEDPIIATAKKLTTSAKAAVRKHKAAAIKSKVKVAMAGAASPTKLAKKTSEGSVYKRFVPYIVRACVNPFTLFAMTKAYFLSLFDINYLKEDESQNLRSALQEKARTQNASSSRTKPTRKMKPGQAKTLSDLPQLSA